MGSGPRAGLGEIHLPDLQPGSSIMPGKVNPVLCEATLMVCAQVIGNDAAVAFAGTTGQLRAQRDAAGDGPQPAGVDPLLANVSRLLADRCIAGIKANVERCRTYAESSPSIVTPLNRYIGYEKPRRSPSRRSKRARRSARWCSRTGYVEDGKLTEEQLDAALDVLA